MENKKLSVGNWQFAVGSCCRGIANRPLRLCASLRLGVKLVSRKAAKPAFGRCAKAPRSIVVIGGSNCQLQTVNCKLLLVTLLAGLFFSSKAQDSSLLAMLDDSLSSGNNSIVDATFKGIHVVNAHTIESPGKQDLNFIIMHRFGKLNDGAYNFFGLDNASVRIGFDYGITDKLAVGIGRSSVDKMFDGYLKYKLLRQSTGKNAVPVSISVLGTITNYTLRYPDKPYLNAKYRTAYTLQALLARKFSSALSLQLSPTWLHFNLVPTVDDNNDVFAAVIAGRLKVTKRMSITGEYNFFPTDQLGSLDLTNSLSLGWEIETGGHVFQLVFSNSQGMTEPQFITRTFGSWGKGDIYFGFNVSRNFSLGKKKKSW